MDDLIINGKTPNTQVCRNNNNGFLEEEYEPFEDVKDQIESYFHKDNQQFILPDSLKEYLEIEYTVMFVNLEGDIAEFHLKLNNELLLRFPFLHVEHPLYEFYQFLKKNPEHRIIQKFPNAIPPPIKDLFLYLWELENKKMSSDKISTNILKEKQILEMKEKEKAKSKDQSYSSLFIKYMESDEESEKSVSYQKKESAEKDIEEINKCLKRIIKLPNCNSVMSYLQFLINQIENVKWLQYGSKEYTYFKNKMLEKNKKTNEITSLDIERFFFLLDEHNINFESIFHKELKREQNEQKQEQKKNELERKLLQRRERLKEMLQKCKK